MQTAESTELKSDIWSNSLTGSSRLDTAGSLLQPNMPCLSTQSSDSQPLSLVKCMPSVCLPNIVFEFMPRVYFSAF